MKLEGVTCGEGFVNTKKYQRGDRGLLVFTFSKNKKSSKAKAKKIRNKKIFQPRLKGNQYFGGLLTKHPIKYGPNASSNQRLDDIARLDGPLSQRGQVNSENIFKKCLNKSHSNDSPVIAIESKLVQFDSRSSELSPLSGSVPKSIPKVLI